MSAEAYDEITAQHYKAYRPPLHALILEQCLGKETFKNGLDIGCGTGKSTVALKKFCKTVVGVDPNVAMLNNATPSQGVSYKHFDGKNLNFQPQTFDIITLAGSWWYGKSQALLDEIQKVGASGTKVLLYDFEVLFTPIYQALQLELPTINNTYDHAIDFSGFDSNGFEIINKKSEEIKLDLTTTEMSHLLFSEKEILMLIKEIYGSSNTFEKVDTMLEKKYGRNKIAVLCRTYYTVYAVAKG